MSINKLIERLRKYDDMAGGYAAECSEAADILRRVVELAGEWEEIARCGGGEGLILMNNDCGPCVLQCVSSFFFFGGCCGSDMIVIGIAKALRCN